MTEFTIVNLQMKSLKKKIKENKVYLLKVTGFSKTADNRNFS